MPGGMGGNHYKITVKWSINTIHCYYQWKLLKLDFFYFKTETTLINDVLRYLGFIGRITEKFACRLIFVNLSANHKIFEKLPKDFMKVINLINNLVTI